MLLTGRDSALSGKMENYNGEGSAVVGATGIPSHATNFFVMVAKIFQFIRDLPQVVFSAAILALFAVYAIIHINASQNDGLMDYFSILSFLLIFAIPCYVVVYTRDDGRTAVIVMDPVAEISMIGNPDITEIAKQVAEKMQRVLAAL